jgi:hypothetical protein
MGGSCYPPRIASNSSASQSHLWYTLYLMYKGHPRSLSRAQWPLISTLSLVCGHFNLILARQTFAPPFKVMMIYRSYACNGTCSYHNAVCVALVYWARCELNNIQHSNGASRRRSGSDDLYCSSVSSSKFTLPENGVNCIFFRPRDT